MAISPAINGPIDCGLATTSPFSRQFAKQTISNRTADLVFITENKEIESGSTSSITVGDINYTRTTFPTSGTNVRVLVDYKPEKFGSVSLLSSSDNSVLEKSTTDPLLFEYRSTGAASITARFNTNEQTTKLATTSTTTETTRDDFVSFQSDSVGEHVFDQIRQYADSSTSPPNHYPIYSTFDFNNNVFVRNIGHWAYPLDFSGLMVNKSGSGGVTMVTAITPYHAVGVSHYHPEVGDNIVFCDSNNQTVTRQVVSGGGPAVGRDYWMVKFDQPLPSSVKKYKLLPSNYSDFFPLNRTLQVGLSSPQAFRFGYSPIIVCSHYRWDAEWALQRPNRYAYIYEAYDSYSEEAFLRYSPAQTAPNNFQNYNGNPSNIRGGDSGGPCFMIINNDLVLVALHTTSSSGTFVSDLLDETQDFIDELGPSGQTIQTVDLSGFTDFSS